MSNGSHGGGDTDRVSIPALFAEHLGTALYRASQRVGEVGSRLSQLGKRIALAPEPHRKLAIRAADAEITAAINALDELRESLRDARELVRGAP